MSPLTRNILIALGMTILIVITVTYAVEYLDRLRLSDIQTMQNNISTETLSLETQFSLLETAPCDDSTASSTTLSSELADLGSRLSYAEEQLGSDNSQVIQLKKQYYLLEIRDYLITKRLAAACKTKPVIILYFYSNTADCSDCDKAGYALSYLRNTYPSLRVYSFDYNLDLGALKTLIFVTKVNNTLPAFVINGKQYYGFKSLEDLEKQFPNGALSTTKL